MTFEVDRILVDFSKESLKRVLQGEFGGDTEAKVAWLDRIVEHVKSGYIPKNLVAADHMALFEVLKELKGEEDKDLLKILDERKGLVLVDDKLLEWLGRQVEAGKYDSLSHAIEVLILKEMKE